MSEKRLEIVLWVAFTVLFFVVFCGGQFLISGAVDMPTAILFFVVLGLVDKRGIAYLVDYYMEKRRSAQEGSPE